MATRIGYIGLGNMGKAMASNLAPEGFDACVYGDRCFKLRSGHVR